MKILIACEMPEAAREQFRALALNVDYRPTVALPELRDALVDASVLVVGEIRVSPEALRRANALQLIVHAGPGPGDIAIDDASTQGVFVAHCPDQHAVAVAEHAFGLILALDRQIATHTTELRAGNWNRAAMGDARGLAGATLGLLGFGTAGRLLARRARAFDMRVLVWTPQLALSGAHERDIEFCNWPRELARQADMVVVLSVRDERGVLVDADFVQALRDGSYLVHLGAPGAVDEAAVAQAVEQRGLRAAFDVFASEPGTGTGRFRWPFPDLPHVVATPHVGALTAQAQTATCAEVVRIVHDFMVTGEVHNCLNVCDRSPATWQLVLRVRDQVGVMASILEAVRADGVNAQEITSRVFSGAKAAWCTIALDERPSSEALESIRALSDVLHLELRAVV